MVVARSPCLRSLRWQYRSHTFPLGIGQSTVRQGSRETHLLVRRLAPRVGMARGVAAGSNRLVRAAPA